MQTANMPIEQTEDQISDFDRDSLWSLPLVMLPLQSKGLKSTRLVKNSQLEGVVELFNDSKAGRGHVSPDHLHKFFSGISNDDVNVVRKVSTLKSYDVYSLRISLRQIGINVENYDNLKLSRHKEGELQEYMQPFLSSLITNIFDPDISDIGDKIGLKENNWINIFYNPDVNKTRKHLRSIANKMNISLLEVPSVIQKYGDVYLSIAYYRQCLDDITPRVGDFVNSLAEIVQHQQIKNDFPTLDACKRIHRKIKHIQSTIKTQFLEFDESSQKMWDDMSPEKFKKFKEIVEGNHLLIGALLCALAVKMNHWGEKFPNPSFGGPMQRADFIMNDMSQGWLLA